MDSIFRLPEEDVSDRAVSPDAEAASRITVCGVNLINCTTAEALKSILAGLAARTRQAIFFVNANGLYMAMRDSRYRAVLNAADSVFADGTGVRWASRRHGVRLRDNVNGTDLVPLLLSARAGLRVFLVGGLPERVWALEHGFRVNFPDCRLVGVRDGYIGRNANRGLIEAINEAKPDILLVGMGNPLQEQWISENLKDLQCLCAIAVGGLFQYWTGDLDRAPRWMRRAGIEWAHIVLRQPRKLYRYFLLGPLFLLRAFRWNDARP